MAGDVIGSALSGQSSIYLSNPGRRFATFRRCVLPWATMWLPRSGRITLPRSAFRGKSHSS